MANSDNTLLIVGGIAVAGILLYKSGILQGIGKTVTAIGDVTQGGSDLLTSGTGIITSGLGSISGLINGPFDLTKRGLQGLEEIFKSPSSTSPQAQINLQTGQNNLGLPAWLLNPSLGIPPASTPVGNTTKTPTAVQTTSPAMVSVPVTTISQMQPVQVSPWYAGQNINVLYSAYEKKMTPQAYYKKYGNATLYGPAPKGWVPVAYGA